jgi:hypothetical protein
MSDFDLDCIICQKQKYDYYCANCPNIKYCDKCFESIFCGFCIVCGMIFCEECTMKDQNVCRGCQKNGKESSLIKLEQ